MKDLAHHLKQLNRKIIRSLHRTEMEETNGSLPDIPQPRTRSKQQLRKQAKAKMRKETLARTPTHPTEDERNWQRQHRVPIFDKWNHPAVKVGARPTKKKTPPLRRSKKG